MKEKPKSTVKHTQSKAKHTPELTKRARTRIEQWREHFKFNIDQYHEMHEFVLGRQWSEQEEDMLTTTFNKVPLQFNKLGTLCNTLLGEQQQNTPQLEVYPLTNCSQQTAEIRQNVVKDCMLSQNAKGVYQTAAKQAIIGGFGAFCIASDYTHNRSFDQEIVYRSFKDATRAFWDVGAEKESKIDGMFGGYIARMTREKFKQVYGEDIEDKIVAPSKATEDKEVIALVTQPSTSNDPFCFDDGESISIIYYYEREMEDDMLYKLSNGNIVNQEEMDEIIEQSKQMIAQQQQEIATQAAMMGETYGQNFDVEALDVMALYQDGEMIRIEEQRESTRSKITEYLLAGEYTLDSTDAPCENIPVIFMDQNSYYNKEGKQICRPFVSDAIDAQRYLNYLGTQSAYILKISRYDQFMASKRNVQSDDVQQTWRDPLGVKGVLLYDASPTGEKPEQLRPPELSASLGQQYERAIQDMYTSTGMYPARLGQGGGEVSGAAIDARTRQGSYPTYVTFNAINSAITAGGTIVNEMIPRVYDAERVLSLMTPDKGRQNVTINKQVDEYGATIENDLRKGSFEVRLQAGPSYEGQKAEALDSLNMVLKGNPQLFTAIADLYAENLPLANTIEIKNRLKTLVPPEILEAGKTGEMPQGAQKSDPAAEAAAMQAQADAQYKMQQIEIKKQELEMRKKELETKTELELMEMEMKHLEYQASLEEQKLRYMAETDRTRSDSAISHADNITKLLTQHLQQQTRSKEKNVNR